ncbi:MAG TPA: TIGR04255 family protein [Bryobacteraceae bacterium]|nr:TIGR04255 family protein [Bryobacteraceae bacterium]
MEAETKTEYLQRASKKYARAPITEAIIEIRVRPSSGVTGISCKEALEAIKKEYPDATDLMKMEAEIRGGPQVGALATQALNGCARRSDERRQVVTAMPDRFAFSQLQPYAAWEEFQPTAKSLWRSYALALKPEAVTRIATRFVNRIELPLPVSELGKYLLTAPTLSPMMPQKEIAGAFMQLQLPQKDLRCNVLLNLAILPPGESTFPVILDTDISDEGEFSALEDDLVWARLEEFRWRKNEIFEACVTDEVRSLIS